MTTGKTVIEEVLLPTIVIGPHHRTPAVVHPRLIIVIAATVTANVLHIAVSWCKMFV